MAVRDADKSIAHIKPEEKFDFFNDERVRSAFYQILTAGIVGWTAWYLISNTMTNLEIRGMNTGFGFLTATAGFDTDFKLIEYVPGTGTYGRIFLIGCINTLLVSFFAIIASTILGFFVGVLRLSSNWTVAKVSLTYVELVRNTPLLIQIVFWYSLLINSLPRVKQSYDISFGLDLAFMNIRGVWMVWPVPGEAFWLTGVAFVIAAVGAVFLRGWAKKRQDTTGEQFPIALASIALIVALPSIVYLASGSPMEWDVPVIKGFNYRGGFSLPISFVALLLSLTLYHAAHLAESVRAGILSVNKGQTEAALAIGLKPGRAMSLIIIPQAMRAIMPPMISLWMNVVKNSSLAIAIGYSDVVSLFMQTALNQAGYAVEMVGMTMLFYMVISLSISGVLNIYNKRVQLVER